MKENKLKLKKKKLKMKMKKKKLNMKKNSAIFAINHLKIILNLWSIHSHIQNIINKV